MKDCQMTRVEKHVIHKSNPYYRLLIRFCEMSKNLYNHANYIVRQKFIEDGTWARYSDLDEILKNDAEYPDYRNMPTAQSAQQILRLLDKNWKSFFKSIKDWAKHKDKYLGRPKMPKYLKKNSLYLLVLTNQNCKLVDGVIRFPKVFDGFSIKPKFTEKENAGTLQQVRIIPHKNRIVVEVVYTIHEPVQLQDNGRYIGIDIGVDNLATVANNISVMPFIINGKPLKSINKYFNKIMSHYREICKRMNGRDYSKRMDSITEKRNTRIDDYLHKASRYIINFCIQHDVHTIVIGKNNEWKQSLNIGKVNNQTFVQIPFARFIEMIMYKAEEVGIAVVLTEESYTSGTSFIDNESPIKEFYNKCRRKSRGMFVSNSGIKINADLNGAYQIIKKVFPIKWDIGCALHPVVVNLC